MYHQKYPPVPLCNRCNRTPFFGTLWHPHARRPGPPVETPGPGEWSGPCMRAGRGGGGGARAEDDAVRRADRRRAGRGAAAAAYAKPRDVKFPSFQWLMRLRKFEQFGLSDTKVTFCASRQTDFVRI